MAAWVIRGRIFDGTGAASYDGAIRIRDGKIAEIARGRVVVGGDEREIDARGHWVVPGFIDIHTHYDGEIEVMPELAESVRHGVTTIFLGSCGLGMVMGSPDDLSDMYTRVEGIPSGVIKPMLRDVKRWDGPPGYYDHLQQLALGPNVACFLGHSTIRAAILGLAASLDASTAPSADQLASMAGVVNEAIEAGYLGLSINSLEFDRMDGARFRGRFTPSVYARRPEYAFLARALRRRGRVLQLIPSLMRPLQLLRSFLLSTGVLRRGLKVSVVTLADTRAFRGLHRVVGGLAQAANRWFGAEIRMQAVPAPFELWVDGLEMPAFEEFDAGTRALHLDGGHDRSALLRDPVYRAQFKRQWRSRRTPRIFHRDLAACEIIACPDPAMVGRTFAELAAPGRSVDRFLDLLAEHGNAIRWRTVAANDRPDELGWIVSHPAVQIGFADSGAHLRNMAFYNFPLRLLRFVHERSAAPRSGSTPALTVERAVHRLTGELAAWYGIDAGRLVPGARADLAVIDPTRFHEVDGTAHEVAMPAFGGLRRVVRRNDGVVPWVFINGRLAFDHGKPAPELGRVRGFGQVLRAITA